MLHFKIDSASILTSTKIFREGKELLKIQTKHYILQKSNLDKIENIKSFAVHYFHLLTK